MSLGYASRLSFREDLGGQLGAPEHRETSESLKEKIDILTELIRESGKTVVFTGAGISTSSGIPDFRSPKGIWTLQRNGKELPKLKTSFSFATPSLTHQALKCLVDNDIVDFVVSQNVDGLHLRSGLPSEKLAELHGNCFTERCSICRAEYVRDFEMETVGFRLTGRRCVADGCVGRLKDNILDWEDPLPEDKLELSEEMSASASLALCLGTSLQITPACDIPLETVRTGGKLVIVNLQKTPKDKNAFLVIRHEVDKVVIQVVMSGVMKNLQLKVPKFLRTDSLIIFHRQATPTRSLGWCPVIVEVISQHGFLCPIPMVSSVRLEIKTSEDTEHETILEKWPFTLSTKQATLAQASEVECIHSYGRFKVGSSVDVTCHIAFVSELSKQSIALEYAFKVLNKASHQKYLQNGRLSTHSALQVMSSLNRAVLCYGVWRG